MFAYECVDDLVAEIEKEEHVCDTVGSEQPSHERQK